MKKTYKIGKVVGVEIEGQKAIQIPVTVSEQVDVRHGELPERKEIPVIKTSTFNVGIPVTDLPAFGKRKYIKTKIKEAYQQYLANQDKYKDLDNLEFTE